ncbi:MAG TPA: nitroreductase family protein [Candidatus Polarisedimenticolia bacterium]|nr:nitroreductase family protein [Candidatus Polarisedimenticolia bacterium]
MAEERFVPLRFDRLPAAEQIRRLEELHARLSTRRSVRAFSSEPVPVQLIERAVRIAGGAPSGANLQPWRFVLVSDPATKRRIREEAEAEERRNYEVRFPQEWKDRLGPLGTDWRKDFLETAPHLIVVFAIVYGKSSARGAPGELMKHYYVNESVGIATGFLLAALHMAGLATLTHTPSPMGFLSTILGRPPGERAFLLIPVGYPADGAQVPDIEKKPLQEILTRFEPG